MSGPRPSPARLGRRALLGGAVGAAGCGLLACAAPPPPKPPEPEAPPPLRVPELTGLLPEAGLRWAVLVKPRDIAAIPWLIPAIGQVAPEPNLDAFTAKVGFDLRQIPEAAVATYASEGGAESTLYLVRHNGDPQVIERLFRVRLTGDVRRSVDRADVVRVSGKIGQGQATLAVLGPDVVGFQFGGSPSRGPARVATLYALGRLEKSPTLLTTNPLEALAARLGPAPLRAFALGPFEGELRRGARGLLAGATAFGATVRPSAREGLFAILAVAGDFAKAGERASHQLAQAWNELATGTFGHLLGLDQPVQPPIPTHAPDAVTVAVEVDPNKLAKGLRAATSATIEEIMR